LLVLLLVALEGTRRTTLSKILVFGLLTSGVLLFVGGIIRLLRSRFASVPPRTCPSVNLLKDLLAERLAPREHTRLAAHLEGCTVCQHRVEGLTAGHKSWPPMARKLS